MTRFILTTVFLLVLPLHAEDVTPPRGFTALFNGKDLSGWHGMPTDNLRNLEGKSEAERKDIIATATEQAKKEWRVETGELLYSGGKTSLATDRDFGDVEIHCEVKGHVALFSRGYSREISLFHPDRWNTLRFVQVGERTQVYVNGKREIDHISLLASSDSKTAPRRKGPIHLTARKGTALRNLFAREIPSTEANEILRKRDADSFKNIFNGKDFTGWSGPLDNYEIVEEAIVCKPKKGGVIFTKEEYTDFVVRLEYRVPPGGNNGLALRYPGKGQASIDAMCEIQVLDDDAPKYSKLDPRQANGSAYGMAAARKGYQRPVGEWNFMEVTVRGPKIQVEVNGTRILDTDLSKVTQFMGGKPHPGKDRTSGNFGFCGHNDPVAFRSIQIKRLP